MTVILLGCGGQPRTSPMPDSTRSPYAEADEREIKALSAAQLQGYLNGEGMGLARVAELHHYPGPRHVLDLADELSLTGAQRKLAKERFEMMRMEATDLGSDIVELERELDLLFSDGEPNHDEVRRRVVEIGRLNGALRFVHLREHLFMREVLSAEQIRRYDQYRGYADSETNAHVHGDGNHP